jgi:hypothetical protein
MCPCFGSPLKDSNAVLAIFVLPIDLRSFISITRVLSELLINPAAAIVAPPDLSKDEPARDRSPRNDDSPKVPDFHPRRLRQLMDLLA